MIMVVSEFAGVAQDGFVASACAELALKRPDHRLVFVVGFLKRYRYGGLRPSRLLNYAVVYARSLAGLLRYRPDVVIVDTTPPLIQLWMALLGPLFKARVYVWMMDYHPEIEARALDRIAGLRWLARLLRAADRSALRRVSGVLALDEAMADTVRARCGGLDVKVHPPWSVQGCGQYQPVTLNRVQEDLRIAYVGNLGAAHGLEDLEQLLAAVRPRRLSLLIVGGNAAGLQRWREIARRLEADIQSAGRLPWDELYRRLNEYHPNYALVLLDENKVGLVAPSKYATYIRLGVPVLYLGPHGTNADRVCRILGAGLAATRDEIIRDRATLACSLLDPAAQERRRAATKTAHEALAKFNATSFVEMLRPWLEDAAKAEAG